jgi:hypothetical protein
VAEKTINAASLRGHPERAIEQHSFTTSAHIFIVHKSIMVYTVTGYLYAKDDKESIEKLRNKLIEASSVFTQDKETIICHVMQEVKDPRSFTMVERYEKETV